MARLWLGRVARLRFGRFPCESSEIIKKKFCTLINSWDPDKHRTIIYKICSNIGKITCPGKLFNNISNNELNKIGKKKYINQFIFNICSENYISNNIPGYITEKIMDCCLSGAIPIYAGNFDNYDSQIFNKDRIIFYDNNKESYVNVYHKLKFLIDNPNKLYDFYKKPVFCINAFDTITKLKKEFINKLN